LGAVENVGAFLQKRRFALGKPPFYPLNYGDKDFERINGLNGDGQGAVPVRTRSVQTRRGSGLE